MLPHVTLALTSSDLSLAATRAIKDISWDCTDIIKPYAKAVIAGIQQYLQAGLLNQGECVRLMHPLGKMPLLLLPAQTYSQDTEVTEAQWANLKQGVATTQEDRRPLTQQVRSLVLDCYAAAPQPAAIDLAKQSFIMLRSSLLPASTSGGSFVRHVFTFLILSRTY